jgi:hypothetical protein
VFLLGAIAWHLPALIIGMVTSVLGMAFRYKAHLDTQRQLRKAEAARRG